jgi:ERCC4-related helicase
MICRYAAQELFRILNRKGTTNLRVEKIVGHGDDDGMEWRQQESILQRFRTGDVQVVIATSVLEKGLDVPTCNLVVCYDGIQSLM